MFKLEISYKDDITKKKIYNQSVYCLFVFSIPKFYLNIK